MVKIEAYETNDGQVFTKEEDAIEHESKLEMKKIAENISSDIYYYNVGADGITEGLLENIEELCKLVDLYRKIKINK